MAALAKDIDKKEFDRNVGERIAEAGFIEETMRTQGWKLIEQAAKAISDPIRLKPKSGSSIEIEFKEYAYIAGQIEGIEKLFRQIHGVLKLRDARINEQNRPT